MFQKPSFVYMKMNHIAVNTVLISMHQAIIVCVVLCIHVNKERSEGEVPQIRGFCLKHI